MSRSLLSFFSPALLLGFWPWPSLSSASSLPNQTILPLNREQRRLRGSLDSPSWRSRFLSDHDEGDLRPEKLGGDWGWR